MTQYPLPPIPMRGPPETMRPPPGTSFYLEGVSFYSCGGFDYLSSLKVSLFPILICPLFSVFHCGVFRCLYPFLYQSSPSMNGRGHFMGLGRKMFITGVHVRRWIRLFIGRRISGNGVSVVPRCTLLGTRLGGFSHAIQIPLPVILRRAICFQVLLCVFGGALIDPVRYLGTPLVARGGSFGGVL